MVLLPAPLAAIQVPDMLSGLQVKFSILQNPQTVMTSVPLQVFLKALACLEYDFICYWNAARPLISIHGCLYFESFED